MSAPNVGHEPLPPLVEDARTLLAEAIAHAWRPVEVRVWLPTEAARALLAWLDRGRP